MNTAVDAIKIACRALMSRHGLDIHVHHHHWHHSTEPEDSFTDQDLETRQSRMFQQGTQESIAAGESPAQIAELADGPAPAPCELPAYRQSTDVPPQVKQKPVFRFQVSEYVA